jgi:hypothetical protein
MKKFISFCLTTVGLQGTGVQEEIPFSKSNIRLHIFQTLNFLSTSQGAL